MSREIKEFVIERRFNAPKALVWKMFTVPGYMRHWYGPKGTESECMTQDFSVGGMYHFRMKNPDGSVHWGKQSFKEIEPTDRLVYINSFSDEAGNLIRHPLNKRWPLELLTAIHLKEDGNSTLVELHWSPIKAKDDEIQTFNENHESMTNGWGGSFDQLEAYLKSIDVQKITPFMWFNDNAEEAAKFYTCAFEDSRILCKTYYEENGAKVSGKKPGSVMTVDFKLRGQRFTAINGSPEFPFSQAISFYVHCTKKEDVDMLFGRLSESGEIMMKLGRYPFNDRYAFLKDRYGVSWQLIHSPHQSHIASSLLFAGKDLGKAEDAINFYTGIFEESMIDHIMEYGENEDGMPGTVMHSSITLENQEFILMDGAGKHDFNFNESVSFVVSCSSQQEIDHYWDKLSEKGEEGQCGWLKDRFGVSWQVVPTELPELLSADDPSKKMAALLTMKKLDIEKLKKA